MYRRDFLCALGPGAVAASLGVTAACSRPRAVEVLTVAATPNVSMAPLYLALEEDRFVEAGLDVRVERFASSGDAIPALAGGRLDAALSPVSVAAVNAARRGSRLRVVAARESVRRGCREFGSLLYRKAAFPGHLQDLAELRGKRVSFGSAYPSSMMEFMGDLILGHAGLAADDIELLNLRGAERFTALLSGKLDAVMISSEYGGLRAEWAGDLAYASGAGRVAAGMQYAFILFGSRLLEGDPRVGTRFLTVYYQAVRSFVGGREPAFVREFAESNQLDYEELRNACRQLLSLDGAIDTPSIQRYLDWAAEKAYMDAPCQADEVIDSRFVTAAAAAAAEHA